MSDGEYLYLSQGMLRFAVPMDEVRSILPEGVYAPVPCTKPCLWGVCYQEGRLYPVVCLAEGIGTSVVGILCCQGSDEAVLLADAVEGLGTLPDGADREVVPGIGEVLQDETGELWLVRLKEALTKDGVFWTGQKV